MNTQTTYSYLFLAALFLIGGCKPSTNTKKKELKTVSALANSLKTTSGQSVLTALQNGSGRETKFSVNDSRFIVLNPHECWDRNDMSRPGLSTNDSEPFAMARSISDTFNCNGVYGCGKGTNKIAFATTLYLMQSNAEQIEYKVSEAIRAAKEYNIPIFFHLNFEWMFTGGHCFGQWANTPIDQSFTLVNGKPRANIVEYSDWNTPATGYVVNWGAPHWMPPKPNFSSPDARLEMKQKAQYFLNALANHIGAIGGYNSNLFLGVDVGWETGITDDSSNTKVPPQPIIKQGYGALKSRGYSASNPPADFEAELGDIAVEFAQYEVSMLSGYIPPSKVYTHFLSLKPSDPLYKRHPLHLLPRVSGAVYGISAGWGDNVSLDHFNNVVLKQTGNPDWAVTEAPPEIGLDYFEGKNTGAAKLPKAVVIYSWSAGNVTDAIVNRIKSNLALPNEGVVIGTIDAVTNTGNIVGWACANGFDSRLPIHLYVGGPASSGGQFIGSYETNSSSEPGIASICNASGNSYRYGIQLTSQQIAAHQGKRIYIHGISPNGKANELLGNSGNLTVPTTSSTPSQPTQPTQPTQPAQAGSSETGKIMGNIEAVSNSEILGWACGKNLDASIDVHLYAGNSAYLGGQIVAIAKANIPSEEAVAQVCGANGRNYRFSIPLTNAIKNQFQGKSIFVHGISPTGKENAYLSNSGVSKIPNPPIQESVAATSSNAGVIAGTIDGLTGSNVAGWACAIGYSTPIQIHMYVGGPAGVGTLIDAMVSNQPSESAVAQACGASGSSYRFGFNLSSRAAFRGQSIYIYGISPNGKPNNLLTNSGVFKVP